MAAYVYMVRCVDGTLYTGWTSDLTRRLAAHNQGKAGAKYTRTRRPVTLVYYETCENRSEAMRREAAVKRLTRAQKECLIAQSETPQDGCLAASDAKNRS